MANLYVVRHGQTVCNAQQVIQGPRIDAQLSDLGHKQAHAVAAAFQETPLDAVFVSPMQRARDTARPLVDLHPDLAAQVAPEMYEMDYGAYCGKTMDEVHDGVVQILDAWSLGFIDKAFPSGESPLVAQHRIRGFCGRVLEEAADKDVVVFAHGRINRILLATLTGTPLSCMERFPQDNGNISHLQVDGEVRVRRLNDTDHLPRP